MKRGFTFIFTEEIKKLLTNYRLLFVIFVIPLSLFFYYKSILNKGVPQKLPIALYDQDETKTSRELVRMLNSTSSLDISSNVNSQEEGESKVRTNEAMGFIIIPTNFEKDIFRGNQVKVSCYYNGEYLLSGSLINRAFQAVIGEFSGSILQNNLMKEGLSSYQAASSLSSLGIDTHILYNPFTNYSYYLSISLMAMCFQLVVMTVTIYVLGSVLKYRKGRELFLASNGNSWVAFWGKVLPYTILFSIIGFFMNTLVFYNIGTPLKGNFFITNLYFILFIIVCQFLALAYVSFCSSLRTALTLGGGSAAISFTFAGYTFPVEGLPVVIQYFSYVFPFTSYLRFTIDYSIRGVPIQYDIKYLVVFSIFIIVGLFSMKFYIKLLKKGCYDSYYES